MFPGIFPMCLNRLPRPVFFSSLYRNFLEFSWIFSPYLNRLFPLVFPVDNRKVCTRNDDLEDVISRTPVSRREDLVFLQNSVLGPLLEKHGLAKNTQASNDGGMNTYIAHPFECFLRSLPSLKELRSPPPTKKRTFCETKKKRPLKPLGT